MIYKHMTNHFTVKYYDDEHCILKGEGADKFQHILRKCEFFTIFKNPNSLYSLFYSTPVTAKDFYEEETIDGVTFPDTIMIQVKNEVVYLIDKNLLIDEGLKYILGKMGGAA